MFYNSHKKDLWNEQMAVSLAQTEQKEIHYFGEPWSLNDLERIPHLHFLATSIREALHADKTVRDKEFQNKVAYEAFVELCNKDIIFLLKINQQYYLLSKLFEEVLGTKGKWAHFVDELRHQNHQQINQEGQFIAKSPTVDRPLPSVLYVPPSAFAWNEPDPNWSNFQKWQHYEAELKRITSHYHQQKVAIYQEAANEDIKFFDNVLSKLKKGSTEYDDIKAVKDEFDIKKKELLSRNIYNSNGDIDSAAVEKLERDWIQAHKEMNEGFEKCCRKHPHNTVLQDAYTEHQTRHQNLKAKINKLDVEFEKARSELSDKIKECRTACKEEVDEKLKEMLQAVDKADLSELSESDKERLMQLSDAISNSRTQLASATNSEQCHTILSDIAQKFKEDAHFLPQSLKDKIQPIAAHLENITVHEDSKIEKQATNDVVPDVPHSFPSLDASQEEFDSEAVLADSDLGNSVIKNNEEVEGLPQEHASDRNLTIEKVRMFKAQNIVQREQLNGEVNHTQKDASPLSDMFNGINEEIKIIIETKNPSEAILGKLNEIKELISEISTNPREAMEKMDDLYDKISDSEGVFFDPQAVVNELDGAQEALEHYLANDDEASVTPSLN